MRIPQRVTTRVTPTSASTAIPTVLLPAKMRTEDEEQGYAANSRFVRSGFVPPHFIHRRVALENRPNLFGVQPDLTGQSGQLAPIGDGSASVMYA